MERQKPETTTNEIKLYSRTYYSLLRSSGEVRVRSFEEAHSYSNASLHSGARERTPDIAAFGYAAARLPESMPWIQRIVLGQSDETFAAFGFDVASWKALSTRGRRRLLRGDGRGTLAAYIASSSDIDDLVPIVTAYQIEWNKMHELLRRSAETSGAGVLETDEGLAAALRISVEEVSKLREALGAEHAKSLETLAARPLDLRFRLLAGSFSQYQAAAQLWWRGVERAYGGPTRQAPTYFVSSNTHALANLLGGYALAHADELLATARAENPDGVLEQLERELARGPEAAANLLYFVQRTMLACDPGALERIAQWDARSGIRAVENRAHVDVAAQVIEVGRIRPECVDPRVRVEGIEELAESDARILNIDYPLGMAAYHLLSRVGQGAPLLGAYIMGKAATLNGQVGDVLISRVVHDQHSENTYLLANAFSVGDLVPFLENGSVLDNQKAVAFRGPFLQNPNLIGVFYREGYTVIEMEAGPYLSAIYELAEPRRHPNDEIVNLASRAAFEIGILHYASDTPYSRRQTLLSKSLGAFGVDSTYACAIAITRRILSREVERLRGRRTNPETRP